MWTCYSTLVTDVRLSPGDTNMINTRALGIATAIGTVLQLAMVLAGHSSPAVALLFGPIGVTLSLVAGIAYAWKAGNSTPGALALGGLVAGGACALLGIAVSYLLGDVPALILVAGTLSSAVTEALGGWLGRFMFRGARQAA